jgi:hypothetical protein
MIQHHPLPFIGVACKPPAFDYTECAPETAGAGRENPGNVGGQPPQCGIFHVRQRSRAPFFYGGPGGAAFGLAGAYVPVSHPRCQGRHPSRENERRPSTTNVGGRNG